MELSLLFILQQSFSFKAAKNNSIKVYLGANRKVQEVSGEKRMTVTDFLTLLTLLRSSQKKTIPYGLISPMSKPYSYFFLHSFSGDKISLHICQHHSDPIFFFPRLCPADDYFLSFASSLHSSWLTPQTAQVDLAVATSVCSGRIQPTCHCEVSGADSRVACFTSLSVCSTRTRVGQLNRQMKLVSSPWRPKFLALALLSTLKPLVFNHLLNSL